MKIKDIKNIHVFDEQEPKKPIVVKRDAKGNPLKTVAAEENYLINGMNDDAYNVYKIHQDEMTN
jgi:hypothetical protein